MIRQHKPILINVFTSTFLLISCCVSLNLYAQIEEIVVTAQKREQNLQDVPISVSVLDAQVFEVRNENEISSLRKLSPGFTFSDGPSAANTSIQIRGVGSQTTSRGVEQSVSTVIDGVVATSLSTAIMDFNDVERVEVLRGPQGMLFGKNASAGVLNIVTKRPTEEFEAMLGASYGSEDEIKVNGYISGPLGDKLGGRLSFFSNTRDGYLDNIAGPDFNDRGDWGVRAKLAFEASDNLDILVTYNHAERDNDICCEMPAAGINAGFGFLGETLGIPAGPENDVLAENNTSTGSAKLDSIVFDVNYQWGKHTLTSITSYVNSDVKSLSRTENLPVSAILALDFNEDVEQFTQELRLTSPGGETLDYIFGLYYFNKETKVDNIEAVDLFSIVGVPPGVLIATAEYDPVVDNESYAFFGNVTWNINDRARLTGGLRLNREEVDMDYRLDAAVDLSARFPGYAVILPGPGQADAQYQVSESDTAFLWRVIGEYDVTDDAMLYASVSRGYKGLGANAGTSASDPAATPIVRPEVPTNYEIGLRSTWLDNRLVANATLFFTEFEDFQASLSTGIAGPPQIFLSNANELETKGLELELMARATDNLFLSASLAYIEAEITDYPGAPCYVGQTVVQGCTNNRQDLAGGDVPNSPDLSFTVSGTYEWDFAGLPFGGFINASYYWQDDAQSQLENGPITIIDSYGLTDLSIGVRSDDDKYSLQFWVKNAFDEFHATTARDFRGLSLSGGQLPIHYLPYEYERRIGISAQIRF